MSERLICVDCGQAIEGDSYVDAWGAVKHATMTAGCVPALRAALERAEREREEAVGALRKHRCGNPSLDEALNSGDGSYRP